MMTTTERDELLARGKYLREHPYVDVQGEADQIDSLLSHDEREMHECSESIARGDACLSCEKNWEPDEEGRAAGNAKVLKLDHLPSCAYSIRLMDESRFANVGSDDVDDVAPDPVPHPNLVAYELAVTDGVGRTLGKIIIDDEEQQYVATCSWCSESMSDSPNLRRCVEWLEDHEGVKL